MAAPWLTHEDIDPNGKNRIHWGKLILLAMCFTLLFTNCAVGAIAQDDRATVRVDGRPVFRVGPSEDADASTRAAQIERRLETLLENPEAIAPVLIEPSGPNEEDRVLSVAGVPVMTVN